MTQRTPHSSHSTFALRALALAAIASLILLTFACKKKPTPVEPPQQPEATQTEPPPQAAEKVEDAFDKPVVEPTERAEDIDETIRQQNQTRGLLKTVYFEFDKAEVREDQLEVLKQNAAWIRSHATYKILVEGHCDERDTIEYNLHLGERRASSVQQYLIDLGIPASRFRTISYGEERPADPGHDEDAYAKNRRAEFTLEK